jgi:hypothetical protein
MKRRELIDVKRNLLAGSGLPTKFRNIPVVIYFLQLKGLLVL